MDSRKDEKNVERTVYQVNCEMSWTAVCYILDACPATLYTFQRGTPVRPLMILGTEGPGRRKSVPGKHGERSFPEELNATSGSQNAGWNEQSILLERRTTFRGCAEDSRGRIRYSRLSSAERYEQDCGGWEAQADVTSASPHRCAFTQNCHDEDS